MKLSILMLALDGRDWSPLANELVKQVRLANEAAALSLRYQEVELIIEVDKGQQTSGQKRQSATARANGDYVCFIDDDDWIAQDYVSSLLEGCNSGADVVTFQMAVTGFPNGLETWAFGLYADRRELGLMTVNHLCAWKKSIATKVAWCPDVGFGDDQLWYKVLFNAGVIKTEFHINRELYHYRYNQALTSNDAERRQLSRRYVGAGLRCFWHGDEILVEISRQQMARHQPSGLAVVRNRHNIVSALPLAELQHFHTIVLT